MGCVHDDRGRNVRSPSKRWAVCRPARVATERSCPRIEQRVCHQTSVIALAPGHNGGAMRRACLAAFVLAAVMTMTGRASAQWFKYPTPGVPRTASGAVDIKAPAPRTTDGK